METNKQKPKQKILIVDDNTDLLEMLSEILIKAGFKIVTATDGVDGTFKFSNEAFDLVITDIKMPKKDGIQLVQFIHNFDSKMRLKPGNSKKATPVILISASIEEYRMDIDLLENIQVLNKPFSPKEVVDMVNSLLDKKSNPSSSPGSLISFKTGEYVIKEGDVCNDMFYVKEGKLNVVKKNTENINVTICTVGAGEMVGEMGFLLHRTRTASVVALTDSVLISIPKEKFESVMADQPKWFKLLFETVTTRLESTTKLLVEEKSRTRT
jgi:DNA-binding response OmpR family regulator